PLGRGDYPQSNATPSRLAVCGVAPGAGWTILYASIAGRGVDDRRARNRLDRLPRRCCRIGARSAGLDQRQALGADRPRSAVVPTQPLKPEPRTGGGPALRPPLSVGPDHRQYSVVLGLRGADGLGGAAAHPLPQAQLGGEVTE